MWEVCQMQSDLACLCCHHGMQNLSKTNIHSGCLIDTLLVTLLTHVLSETTDVGPETCLMHAQLAHWLSA